MIQTISTPTTIRKAAREWATTVKGWRGKRGGWIYNKQDRPMVQGWCRLWLLYADQIADHYTRALTGFCTMDEMVTARGSYRPTILLLKGARDWRYRIVADAYDARQRLRDDPRRAFRGTRHS